MTEEGARTVRVVIRGRVQGVGYRFWTQGQARQRGLSGHVRNRCDGTVEALFSGAGPAVAGMVEACRTGPPGARVEGIDLDPVEDAPPLSGFSILSA